MDMGTEGTPLWVELYLTSDDDLLAFCISQKKAKLVCMRCPWTTVKLCEHLVQYRSTRVPRSRRLLGMNRQRSLAVDSDRLSDVDEEHLSETNHQRSLDVEGNENDTVVLENDDTILVDDENDEPTPPNPNVIDGEVFRPFEEAARSLLLSSKPYPCTFHSLCTYWQTFIVDPMR